MEPQPFDILRAQPANDNVQMSAVSPTSFLYDSVSPESVGDPQRSTASEQPDEGETQSLLASMRQEVRREKVFRRIVLCSGLIGLFLSLIVVVHGESHTLYYRNLFRIAILLHFVNMFVNRIRVSRSRKRAINRLAALEDCRAVGPLADAYAFQNNELKPQVETALIALLPRMRATDASLLNTQQRAILHKALSGDNYPLIMAILKAFEQIGDNRDLDAVQRLADGKGKCANDTAVHTAALECLTYLHTNIERQLAHNMLLRASSSASSTPDMLLRATGPHSETSEKQLLCIPQSE